MDSKIPINYTPKYASTGIVATDASGRISTSVDMSNIYLVKAWITGTSYIVIPYIFRSTTQNLLCFKVLNSENMTSIANTNVNIEYYYLQY